MEKTWSQLSDRCNLFFDAPSGLYKELLKEAECELANQCSLIHMNYSYNLSPSARYPHPTNSLKLPSNYKHMLGVWVNGNLITQKDETLWSFNKTDDGKKVPNGTPGHYTVYNEFLVLDRIPSSSDIVDVKYKANLPNTEIIAKTFLCRSIQNTADLTSHNQVVIDTTLGADLNGTTLIVNAPDENYNPSVNNSGSGVAVYLRIEYQPEDYTTVNPMQPYDNTGTQDTIFDPSPLAKRSTILEKGASFNHRFEPNVGCWYKAEESNSTPREMYAPAGNSVDLTPEMGEWWSKGVIQNYRMVGPVIENDYHLALCDYAVYMASAKKNPDLSMKHQQIWEKRIMDTLTDNIDKELPMGIKEEI